MHFFVLVGMTNHQTLNRNLVLPRTPRSCFFRLFHMSSWFSSVNYFVHNSNPANMSNLGFVSQTSPWNVAKQWASEIQHRRGSKVDACLYSPSRSACPRVLCLTLVLCFCPAGRQQRRAHCGCGLGRVRLPPPTQRHHQPQGYCLHRWVEMPSLSSTHAGGCCSFLRWRFTLAGCSSRRFSWPLQRVWKRDSVPDCRLHNFHPSAVTSLANGGRRCPQSLRCSALFYLMTSPFVSLGCISLLCTQTSAVVQQMCQELASPTVMISNLESICFDRFISSESKLSFCRNIQFVCPVI